MIRNAAAWVHRARELEVPEAWKLSYSFIRRVRDRGCGMFGSRTHQSQDAPNGSDRWGAQSDKLLG